MPRRQARCEGRLAGLGRRGSEKALMGAWGKSCGCQAAACQRIASVFCRAANEGKAATVRRGARAAATCRCTGAVALRAILHCEGVRKGAGRELKTSSRRWLERRVESQSCRWTKSCIFFRTVSASFCVVCKRVVKRTGQDGFYPSRHTIPRA